MKQRTILAVVALATLLLVACDKVEQGSTAVPKEASVVVSTNIINLTKKSDFSNSPLYKMLQTGVSAVVSSDVKGKLDMIAKDPSVTGLNLEALAYAFITPSQHAGLALRVDDESLLEEFMAELAEQAVCTRMKEHDGLKWVRLLDDFDVCFDDNTLLIFTPLDGNVNHQQDEQMMLALMNQDYDESFASTSHAQHMMETGCEDIAVYANMGALPKELVDQYKQVLPKGAKYSDISLVAGVDFKKGSVSFKSLCYSENEKVQAMIDEAGSAFQTVSGEFLNKIPRSAKAWMCMGLHGDKALEKLKQIPQVKELLIGANLGMDIDNMIRAIDGDVLLFTYQTEMLSDNFYIVAQLDNTDFLDDVDYWISSAKEYGLTLAPCGEGYKLSGGESSRGDLYWMVNDKNLYISSMPCDPLTDQGTNAFYDQAKENQMFALVDLSTAMPIFSSVSLSSTRAGELNVELKSESIAENILKLLIRSWNK